MITDDNYKNDDEKIVTEMITFFFAGMKTGMAATTNLIIYLARDPALKKRLIDENEKIFSKLNNIEEDFTLEVAEEFELTRQYYYESLRIEPPVPVTSTNAMSEDCNICGVNVRANDIIMIMIHSIHRNKDEWHSPKEFIPDRFDCKSEYFKRPDGKPRNPMSFVPFTGGKRICIGKTFAEILARYSIPLILRYYNFEYADPTELEKPKRPFDLACRVMPIFKMKIT